MPILDSEEKDSIYDDNKPSWRTNLDDPDLNELEDSYAGPSATDDDLPDKHPDKKSLSSKEINKAEATPSAKTSSDDGDDNEDSGFYKSEKGDRKLNFKKRAAKLFKGRRAIFIGGSSVFLIMGLLLMLTILSSMKVVHFGEILSATGYARLNGIVQERTTQMMFDRAATVGEGELSLRGKSVYDKIRFRNLDNQVAKLGQQGKIKFILDGGNLQGVSMPEQGKTVTLDGITKELGFGEKFSDISKGWSKLNPNDYRRVATVRNEFIKQTRVAINEGLATEPRSVIKRTHKIMSDNVGFGYERWRQKARDYLGLKPKEALIKSQVDLAEKVSGKEIVKTGVEKLDNASQQLKNQEKLKQFLEKNGGLFDEQKFFDDVAKGEQIGSKVESAAQKIGIGLMIGSLACMTNQAMTRTDEVAANNEKSAVKMGLLQIAAKDQQLKGNSNDEAIGAEATTLNGAENSSWYQYATGQQITGEVNVPKIKSDYSEIFDVIKNLSSPTNLATLGLGNLLPDNVTEDLDSKFCNLLLSPEGALVAVGAEATLVAIASFFTGGAAAAGEQAGGQLVVRGMVSALARSTLNTAKGLVSTKSLGTLAAFSAYDIGLNLVVRQLSGTGFMGAETGPEKFERAAVGTNITQNSRIRSLGGAPISNSQASVIDKEYNGDLQTYYKNQNSFNRYLSIKNPNSLISKLSVISPTNIKSGIYSASNQIAHVPSKMNLANVFKPLAIITNQSRQAYAASNYNPYFDNQQWGYTKAEMDKIRFDPTYSSINNLDFISDERIRELDATYGKCFDPSILQVEVEDAEECSADKLRANDEMFRYRLTKLDNAALDLLAEDPEQIGKEDETQIDNSAADEAAPIPLSNNNTCAAGSRDLGPTTGYLGGKPATIKLCAIVGFKSSSSESQPGSTYYVQGANGEAIVGAEFSGSWVGLITAMKSAGLNPTANSSFRTMSHQQVLCSRNSNCNSGKYDEVAKPGTSNHQGGNAIDFANCNTRSTECYKWLAANAGTYGIKNYPKEPWHWSTTGQ